MRPTRLVLGLWKDTRLYSRSCVTCDARVTSPRRGKSLEVVIYMT